MGWVPQGEGGGFNVWDSAYDPTNTAAPTGSSPTGSGGGGIDIPEDAGSSSEQGSEHQSQSTSFSGMPSWFSTWMQDFFRPGLQGPANGMERFRDTMDQFYGPGGAMSMENQYSNIENARSALIDQFSKSMGDIQGDVFQPMMNRMSNRGVLDSSVTGDAMAHEMDKLNRQVGEQISGANTWAAQQKMAVPENTYKGYTSSAAIYQQLLNDILNMGKTGTSQSTTTGSSWGTSSDDSAIWRLLLGE